MTEWKDDFARRTLRFWAVCDVLYSLALAAFGAVVIPWKTPWANVTLLAYAVALALSSRGVWRGRRWGWRLAAFLALLGIGAGVVVATLLVMSWAWLRTVWGSFGLGASLASLLVAAVALQLLVLYPALLLRALLRREIREAVGAGPGWRNVLWALVAVPPLLGIITGAAANPHPIPRLDGGERDLATRYLRARLDGTEPPSLSALAQVPAGVEPLSTVVWRGGEPVFRARGQGPNLAEALEATGDALARGSQADPGLGSGRLRVDRPVGRASVTWEHPAVVALAVDAGVDGLARGDGLLLPDEMIRDALVAATPLIPGIPDLPFGIDGPAVLDRLAQGRGPLQRLELESWVEHGDAALPVGRGTTPGPGTGPDVWLQSARAGGRYLVGALRGEGRFQMVYHPLTDRRPNPGRNYSIPRHAGTVYALAQLYGASGEESLRQAAESAMEWMGERMPSCGSPGSYCVTSGRWANLGSSALAAVAVLEYQRRTGDDRWGEEAVGLLDFILSQQRPDGDFFHRYDVRRQEPDRELRLEYYSEEASFALALGFKVLGDDRYLDGARRALDYLTGPKYASFFLGRFMYGPDHWTCIAAEEAWPALDDPRYLDFCLGYMAFMRRIQYPSEGTPPGFGGYYGFSFFAVPQAANTAAITEATIATYLLAQHHGRDDAELYGQLAASLDALARDQIREDNGYMMADLPRALGGLRTSLVEPEIRIDNVQHASVAWLRGSALRR